MFALFSQNSLLQWQTRTFQHLSGSQCAQTNLLSTFTSSSVQIILENIRRTKISKRLQILVR